MSGKNNKVTLETVYNKKKDRDEWKRQAESLQDDLDSLNEYVTELENENYELSNNNCRGIDDLDRFTYRLKLEGLWTDRMEEFLENYLKFHNN